MGSTQGVDLEQLKERIGKSGYKTKYIIEKLGISRASYYSKLAGHAPIRKAELYVLYDMLKAAEKEKEELTLSG